MREKNKGNLHSSIIFDLLDHPQILPFRSPSPKEYSHL